MFTEQSLVIFLDENLEKFLSHNYQIVFSDEKFEMKQVKKAVYELDNQKHRSNFDSGLFIIVKT